MKENNRKTRSIWLTVLLLCILILASAALLSSCIKRYTAQEKNVFALMADSKYGSDEPAAADPQLTPSWEVDTYVDLFKTTYTDAEGNVTVQSANGDKVIAPGTSNAYEFSLKNTGNISLDYTLKLEGVFRIADCHLPFYVRLYSGNRWVVGGQNQWVHADMLETLVEKDTLPRGETVTYVFEWQWPYESDDESQQLINDLNDSLLSFDANDTDLGSAQAALNTDFHLHIVSSSVVTPGAVAVFADGTGIQAEFWFAIAMIGLILGTKIWLIILFLLRRKKKNQEEVPTP